MRLLFFLLAWIPLHAEESIDKYFIAIKKRGDKEEDLRVYTPLFAPPGKFYADPMVFKVEGLNYLFFEDYDYKKGVISCLCLENGQFQQVLELPIHLSFPYVFQEGSQIYMIPETYQDKSVCLFKASHFPNRWEFVKTLVKGQHFSDSILFKHEGYYWLFTSVRGECLAIYYAKDLQSDFLPHPINYRYLKGRNAGPVYWRAETLIRPVMNSQGGYGKSVILKQIIMLTTKQFIEKEVSRINPDWAPGLDGTHTYCYGEDFIVYDGRRKILPSEDLSD